MSGQINLYVHYLLKVIFVYLFSNNLIKITGRIWVFLPPAIKVVYQRLVQNNIIYKKLYRQVLKLNLIFFFNL